MTTARTFAIPFTRYRYQSAHLVPLLCIYSNASCCSTAAVSFMAYLSYLVPSLCIYSNVSCCSTAVVYLMAYLSYQVPGDTRGIRVLVSSTYSYIVSIYRVLVVCSLSIFCLSLPCAPPVRYTVRKARVDLF